MPLVDRLPIPTASTATPADLSHAALTHPPASDTDPAPSACTIYKIHYDPSKGFSLSSADDCKTQINVQTADPDCIPLLCTSITHLLIFSYPYIPMPNTPLIPSIPKTSITPQNPQNRSQTCFRKPITNFHATSFHPYPD